MLGGLWTQQCREDDEGEGEELLLMQRVAVDAKSDFH
jgi:hypothetical protein